MSTFLGIDNSIGWAHWSLRGGWRNTLLTVGAFLGIVAVVIYISAKLNSGTMATVLTVSRMGLLVLQSGLLVLFGASRVAAAIRSDITNRMIESHRLMPVAPATAISGYLWGPTAQAMALGIVTFLVGLIMTLIEGKELAIWVGPNVILAVFAVFTWVVTAFASGISKGGAGMIVGLIMFMTFSQGIMLVIAPGLILLLTPIIGRTIFTTSLGNADPTWPRLASFVAQALVGSIFYIGAARKYRRSDDTALAVAPALCLLLIWVGMSTLVLWKWDDFRPPMISMRDIKMPWLIIFSILSSMMLSLVGIANAARRGTLPLPPLVAIASASAILLLCVAMREHSEHDVPYTLLVSAAAVGSFLLTLCYVLGIIYRVSKRGFPFGFVTILLLWLVPLIIDWSRWMLQDQTRDFELSPIAGFSPVGALILAWARRADANAIPGSLFQVTLAIVLAILFYLTRSSRRRIVLDGRN